MFPLFNFFQGIRTMPPGSGNIDPISRRNFLQTSLAAATTIASTNNALACPTQDLKAPEAWKNNDNKILRNLYMLTHDHLTQDLNKKVKKVSPENLQKIITDSFQSVNKESVSKIVEIKKDHSKLDSDKPQYILANKKYGGKTENILYGLVIHGDVQDWHQQIESSDSILDEDKKLAKNILKEVNKKYPFGILEINSNYEYVDSHLGPDHQLRFLQFKKGSSPELLQFLLAPPSMVPLPKEVQSINNIKTLFVKPDEFSIFDCSPNAEDSFSTDIADVKSWANSKNDILRALYHFNQGLSKKFNKDFAKSDSLVLDDVNQHFKNHLGKDVQELIQLDDQSAPWRSVLKYEVVLNEDFSVKNSLKQKTRFSLVKVPQIQIQQWKELILSNNFSKEQGNKLHPHVQQRAIRILDSIQQGFWHIS